jgi:branched-chain amino acid transport system permease protein
VTRRLSGFFLAAVTLLFGLAFSAWLVDAESITGGSNGLGSLRPLDLFGWHPSTHQMVIGSAVGVCLVAFLLDRLRLSPWGIIVRTLREAPRAVEAAGVRVPAMNLVALAVGAAIASLGGALFTYSVGSVTPDTFTLNIVFLAIFMPLIGGTGSPWGAVAGAVISVELTLNFPALKTSGTLLLALGVLMIMLLAPRGVLGSLGWLGGRLAALRPAGAGPPERSGPPGRRPGDEPAGTGTDGAGKGSHG